MKCSGLLLARMRSKSSLLPDPLGAMMRQLLCFLIPGGSFRLIDIAIDYQNDCGERPAFQPRLDLPDQFQRLAAIPEEPLLLSVGAGLKERRATRSRSIR